MSTRKGRMSVALDMGRYLPGLADDDSRPDRPAWSALEAHGIPPAPAEQLVSLTIADRAGASRP
jgi:hypothetical protein